MAFEKLKKANLKVRIFALAGGLLALQGLGAFVSTYQARGMLRHVENLSTLQLPATQLSMEADMFHDGLAAKVYQAFFHLQNRDFKSLAALSEETQEMAAKFVDDIDQLEKLPVSESARAQIHSVKPDVIRYGESAKALVAAAQKRDYGRIKVLRANFNADFEKLEASLEALGDTLVKEGQGTGEAGREIVQVILGFSLLSLLMGLAIAAVIYAHTRKVLSAAAFEAWTCANQMQRISRGVESDAAHVKESSIEQAAAIQESVSALTEMASMIAQTSQNVVLSRETSENTRSHAENGKKTMERLAHSLVTIQKSNAQLQELQRVIEEINSKTTVINDIVFKTQLLSFNASIEAARAGHHGRGFAVVAEEVGNLAEMSGQASKEIALLLETSQKKVKETLDTIHARVQDGTQVGQLALRAFDEISEGVTQINIQVKAIGEATQQQEIGIQQTNTALKEMDVTSQSNARASGETLAKAGEMSLSTTSLGESMAQLLALVGANDSQGASEKESPKASASHAVASPPGNIEDLAAHLVKKSRSGKGGPALPGPDTPSADDPSFKRVA
jgi:methyl-accepting chemotaxis protein